MRILKIPTEDHPEIKWIEVYANSFKLHEIKDRDGHTSDYLECDLRGVVDVSDDGEITREYLFDVWIVPMDEMFGVKMGYVNRHSMYFVDIDVGTISNALIWFESQKTAASFYQQLRKFIKYP